MTSEGQWAGERSDASLDRRSVLVLAGAAGIGALAGCSSTDPEQGEDSDWDPGLDLPAALDELHIQTGTEHSIPAGVGERCQSILWEPEGQLLVESGGSLEIEAIDA